MVSENVHASVQHRRPDRPETQRATGYKRADVAEKRWKLGRTVETVDPLQASRGGWLVNVLEKFEPEAACRLHG